MSKTKLEILSEYLSGFCLSNDEHEALPITQAEILIEGVKQLTRIADSLEKGNEPQECWKCKEPDFSMGDGDPTKNEVYVDFKPCQDCCSTAGENIIKENSNEKE